MVRSSSRTVYKPRTFFSHLVAIQYSTRLTLILSGVQWSVNRLVRVGLATLARRRKWKGLSSEPPWISFSFSLHAKHADFTAAYFPAVCPALATWVHIIQWPCEASNRDKDAEAHKNIEWLADSHTAGKGENQYANLGLTESQVYAFFSAFHQLPIIGMDTLKDSFVYMYSSYIYIYISNTYTYVYFSYTK